MLVLSISTNVFNFSRVEIQKMKIVRPHADIARYTMVFHKRDNGNEINKDRSVDVAATTKHDISFSVSISYLVLLLFTVHEQFKRNVLSFTECVYWDGHLKFGRKMA